MSYAEIDLVNIIRTPGAEKKLFLAS